MRLKFWKKSSDKIQEHYDKYYKQRKSGLIEEDTTAVRQNTEEVKFNESNPTYDKRIEKAKQGILKRMSEDKKIDMLYKLNIDESMEERFEDINKRKER